MGNSFNTSDTNNTIKKRDDEKIANAIQTGQISSNTFSSGKQGVVSSEQSKLLQQNQDKINATTEKNKATKASSLKEANNNKAEVNKENNQDIKDNEQNNKKTKDEEKIGSENNTQKATYKQIDFIPTFFEIGKPKIFNPVVDKNYRFGKYLQAKMSIIDLLPVDYGFDFTRLRKSFETEEVDLTGGVYSIQYKNQVQRFQNICKHHGLDPYSGIRLYTTDATTATDSINVQFKDSIFKEPADSLSDVGKTIRDAVRSIGGEQGFQKISDQVKSSSQTISQSATSEFGGSPATQQAVSQLVGTAVDLLVRGNKMTFPKIWQNTTYNNSLSANIKLFSPYGHPLAIKEFILKPLLYLILLASPQTQDGISYGGVIPVTIKAPGMNLTVLGAFNSLTFRRGGGDTSFNLYRQPLTIDVSIDFQALYDSFGVYDPTGIENNEQNKNRIRLLKDYDLINKKYLEGPSKLDDQYVATNTLMTTAGTIMQSLMPVKTDDFPMSPQVYGVFEPPNRNDIPGTPAFTPIMGNLGSSISNMVASVSNFANMVTNAPQLLQQGLANAVYKTAKSSVGSIVGKATGLLNGTSGSLNSVKSKIMGNFISF